MMFPPLPTNRRSNRLLSFTISGTIILISTATVSSILIQFDGSYIRPAPGSGRKGAASCGAAIFRNDGTPVVIGGRHILDVGPDFTSADAEYEGLRFALRRAQREAVRGESLTVRGDCATVVNQMRGAAVPRRMRRHCDAAQGELDLLRPAVVRFERVTRADNALCDSLCRAVVAAARTDAIGPVVGAIADGAVADREVGAGGAGETSFGGAMRLFSDRKFDVVPPHLRIGLYRSLGKAAHGVGDGDGEALLFSGRALLDEAGCHESVAKLRKRSKERDGHNAPPHKYSKELLKYLAIRYEILGRRHLD